MPRTQAPQPLLSASPTLQPGARPSPLSIGATPPPRSSPLMQLAQAFDGLNGELRDMLRDAAAQEEKDATALGEIEATRLRSEGRLAELDKVLKQKVDSGELPSVRLPAAQRAAALRTGHEAASIGLQTELFQRIPDAVKAGPEGSEQIVMELFKKYSTAIPEGSFYERRGFDAAAQDVVSQFRFRVNQEQTAEAERYQKQKRADEGVDLVHQLAAAPADLAPAAKERVKLYLDTIRGEMKKSEVNSFFADSVLKGAVAKLVEEQNFTAADQLLDEVKGLDLTGKGGLFGKTEDGSKVIYELSNMVESKRRTARSTDADQMREKLFLSDALGKNEAASDLYKLRKENGGKLPQSERQTLLNAARERLTDPLAYQSYVATFNSEYENEERWRADPQLTAKLLLEVDTLDPKLLDQADSKLEIGLASREVSASAYHEAKMLVRRNRELVNQIQENDVEAFTKAVFHAYDPVQKTYSTAFGDDALAPVWEELSSEEQTSVRTAAADNFVENFRANIRLLSNGDPSAVPAIKAQAWDRASDVARNFTKGQVLSLNKAKIAKAASAKVAQQAATIRRATSIRGGFGRFPNLTLPSGKDYSLPKREQFVITASEFASPQRDGPSPESDKADVYFPLRTMGDFLTPGMVGRSNVVVLPDLVKEMKESPDAAKAAKAQQVYAFVKGLLGFTPEEILAGKTKHDVAFRADQIDPAVVSVFRSRSELEKHWNNGKPDSTFLAVGDAVDPQDRLSLEQFYLAQLAVFTAHHR